MYLRGEGRGARVKGEEKGKAKLTEDNGWIVKGAMISDSSKIDG
jgi:hypothetical protein